MRDFNIRLFFRVILFFVVFYLLMQILLLCTVPFPRYTKILMKELYNDGPYKVAIVGPSTVYRSVNPEILDPILGMRTITLGSSNQCVMDSYYTLRELYKGNPCEMVLLEISWNRLLSANESFSSKILLDYMKLSANKIEYFINAYPSDYRITAIFPGIQAIAIRDFHPAKMYRTAREKLLYPDETKAFGLDEEYIGRGYVARNAGFDDSRRLGRLETEKWDRQYVDQEALSYYEKTIDYCRSQGSEVVLINMPRMPYTLCGMDNYEDFSEFIIEFAQNNHVDYLDFNLAKPVLFSPESQYFYDTKHLNREGASVFSDSLARFLVAYQRDSFNPKDFFYNSFSEVMQSYNTVFGVWMEKDDEARDIRASASTPPNARVEYEFSYELPSGQFEVFRPYSNNAFAGVDCLPPGEYMLRVNARLAGIGEAFQQYDIFSIQVPIAN